MSEHYRNETADKACKHRNCFFSCTIFFLILSSVLVVGCNSSKSEIDSKYQSGVVLILNRYYYTLTLPDGNVFYLAGDGEGNITDFEVDPDSAVNCMKAVTGTGFFISEDGKIATNKHVASRTVTNRSAVQATKRILKSIMKYLENQNDTCEAIKNQCLAQYGRTTDNIEKIQLVQIYNNLNEKIKENNEIIRNLNYLDPEDAKIEYNSTLKVAYNGTFVRTEDDLFPCTLRDTSDKDIAIIQLNSKQTPSDKYVFPVTEKNMLEHYSFGEYLSRLVGSDKNEQLYMIGFNHGLGMALTDEGIYSQCTEGSVSRVERDAIMYTIPTIQGSSGSPILNRRGQLVAINFAGIRDQQGFNYGVKAKFLYDLMHND